MAGEKKQISGIRLDSWDLPFLHEGAMTRSFVVGSQLYGGSIQGWVTSIVAHSEGVVVTLHEEQSGLGAPVKRLLFTASGSGPVSKDALPDV